MTVYGNILAAVDFSSCASDVVATAAALAHASNAKLTLYHAMNPRAIFMQLPEVLIPSSLDVSSEMRRTAEERMARLAAEAQRAGHEGAWQVEESPDRPADAICHAAKNLQADLIVLGSHGQGAVERALLGSTADRVLHLASCSVLVVKPSFQPVPVDD